MKKGRLVTASALLGVTLMGTGCSGMLGEGVFSGTRGRVLLSADTEGMRAFGDMLTGAIVSGKASPDIEDAHYKLRGKQEQVNVIRYTPAGGGRRDE